MDFCPLILLLTRANDREEGIAETHHYSREWLPHKLMRGAAVDQLKRLRNSYVSLYQYTDADLYTNWSLKPRGDILLS